MLSKAQLKHLKITLRRKEFKHAQNRIPFSHHRSRIS